MIDQAWIETALTSSRPQAVAALLRYFRDLDAAEEAYQAVVTLAPKDVRAKELAAAIAQKTKSPARRA